jgi:hypothetical protein
LPESRRDFLLGFSVDKPPVDRFLSWAISLGLLESPPFGWVPTLWELTRNYFAIPLVERGEYEIPRAVAAALKQSRAWLGSLLDGLPDVDSFRTTRLPRICTAVLGVRPEIDAVSLVFIVPVCFAAAAQFAVAAQFALDFAEGAAFHLALAVAGASHALPSADSARRGAYFGRVSSLVYTVAASNWRYFRVNKIEFDVAAVYEGAFFAGQTSRLGDVLLLWDQIIARVENREDFVTALTISAIQNLVITDACKDVRQLVLSPREWDVEKVVADARGILTHKRTATEWLCLKACPCLRMFHGWVLK